MYIKKFFLVILSLTMVSGLAQAEIYSLSRTIVHFNNGSYFDSYLKGMSAWGTMWIDGKDASQKIGLCAEGRCAETGVLYGELLELGARSAYVVVDSGGSTYPMTLVANGNPLLITSVVTAEGVEIDIWEEQSVVQRNFNGWGYTDKLVPRSLAATIGGDVRVGSAASAVLQELAP